MSKQMCRETSGINSDYNSTKDTVGFWKKEPEGVCLDSGGIFWHMW